MYKNLRQAPQEEQLYISAVIGAEAASMLAEYEVGEGSEIVKTGEKRDPQSQEGVIEIESGENKVRILIPVIKAEEILVRACEICWHCGECMIDG